MKELDAIMSVWRSGWYLISKIGSFIIDNLRKVIH
jgi:hypothetical protein